MEIDSQKCIEILNRNFKYPIVKTKLGDGVQVDCRTAFIYSLVTGAGYLDNPLFPFTANGLMKVFYKAMDYKFVTGLFHNTSLKNTPYILSKAKPYLFNGNKVIIPVEFKTEIELQKKLKSFAELEIKQTDYLIQRIECSKRGNGMEPFMEYLACEAMKKKGYIVENQIPLTHSTGSPDFGGYRLTQIVPSYICNIHLIELALLRLGYEIKESNQDPNAYAIVGEAKTSTLEMKRQLKKYLATHLFNEGFEIHPFKKSPSVPHVGLITIDDQMKLRVVVRKEKKELAGLQQKDYVEWLTNYVKYYLIANLTNDEFNAFYYRKLNKQISSRESLTSFINSLKFEEILCEIDRVVKHGAV